MIACCIRLDADRDLHQPIPPLLMRLIQMRLFGYGVTLDLEHVPVCTLDPERHRAGATVLLTISIPRFRKALDWLLIYVNVAATGLRHAGQPCWSIAGEPEDRHVDADFNALAQPLVHVLFRDRPVVAGRSSAEPNSGTQARTHTQGRHRGAADHQLISYLVEHEQKYL
jgi:hypothetical protein